MDSKGVQEEIFVLFHAAVLGRTDVVQNAIAALRGSNGGLSGEALGNAISVKREEDDATPLHIAAQFGHKDVIRALLNAGAIVDIRPGKGEHCGLTPYEIAGDSTKSTFNVYFFEQVAIGNVDTIQRLIDGGVSVEVRDGSSAEDSALHWASSFGNLVVVQTLLQNGIDPNIRNKHNQTSLHVAAKQGHLEIVRLLLDEAADPSMVDDSRSTALDLATQEDIRTLLKTPIQPTRTLHFQFLAKHKRLSTNTAADYSEVATHSMPSTDLVSPDPVVTPHSSFTAHASLPIPSQSDRENSGPTHISTQRLCVGVDENGVLDDSMGAVTFAPVEHTADDARLVFWPPVQRQSRPINSQPLTLVSSENLLICVSSTNVDLFPVLTWTGFMDVLDSFGFQVQVKRSARGARIRLCINRDICSQPESYSISVNLDQCVVTGADYAGLFYGVSTFLQLLQLHSAIERDDSSSVVHIKIPALHLYDFPSTSHRSILWSQRRYSQFRTDFVENHLSLYSKLRVNELSLVVDTAASAADGTYSEHAAANNSATGDPASPVSGSTPPAAAEPTVDPQDPFYQLEEMCDKYCISLVPTVIISSIRDRLSPRIMEKFGCSVVKVVFMLDEASIARELEEDAAEDASERNFTETVEACIDCCTMILKDCQLAGFATVHLASTKWTSLVADPLRVAGLLGIHAMECPLEHLLPHNLFTKPILQTQSYVASLSEYVEKIRQSGHLHACLPLFMERDFAFSALLLKYYAFMFAGLSWNREAAVDMLGSPISESFSTDLIADVLNHLLFPNRTPAEDVKLQKIVRVFFNADRKVDESLASSSVDLTHGEKSHLSGGAADRFCTQELWAAERYLWSLLNLEHEHAVLSTPTKPSIHHCLILFRKILADHQWKARALIEKPSEMSSFMQFVGISRVFYSNFALEQPSSSFNLESELEELLCSINLLSLASRCLLASYNAVAKDVDHASGHISFQCIVCKLSVGVKSDFANSLLESLSSFTEIWKRKFRPVLLQRLRQCPLFENSSQSSIGTVDGLDEAMRTVNITVANTLVHKRFLLQRDPVIPGFALFRVLCKGLTLPKSLQEYVDRMFV